MPGESPTNPNAASITPEMIAQAFGNQPIVSAMEDDRFCHGCGYNLRGQAARRETMTRVLMVRCPECGAFEPANEPRPWTGRATKFIVGAFVLISLATMLLAMAIQSLGTFIVSVVVSSEWHRIQRSSDAFFEITVSIVLGTIGAAVLGACLCLLAMACIPRWKRVGYLMLVVLWPIPPAAFVATMFTIFQPRYAGIAVSVTVGMFIASVVGGAMGLILGRWPARWLVALVLSPPWRAYLGYLWTIDGLEVPAMDHAGPDDLKAQVSNLKS